MIFHKPKRIFPLSVWMWTLFVPVESEYFLYHYRWFCTLLLCLLSIIQIFSKPLAGRQLLWIWNEISTANDDDFEKMVCFTSVFLFYARITKIHLQEFKFVYLQHCYYYELFEFIIGFIYNIIMINLNLSPGTSVAIVPCTSNTWNVII